VTWIEYNLTRQLDRADLLLGRDPSKPGTHPDREGWLLQQHPTIETAFSAILFSDVKTENRKEDFDFYTFPVAYIWTTDDTPLPWKPLFPVVIDAMFGEEQKQVPSAMLCTGISYYETPFVNCSVVPPLSKTAGVRYEKIMDLIQEWMGVMRRIWALLANINDIPLTHKATAVSRGFMAPHHGGYHKFLDHTVITLNVPERKDLAVIARKIVAMSRRRAHQVRGHWRKNWRKPDNRMWIREHQRGDASLGFVTHDYAVHHPND
jgi:hypothetical protein